MTRFDLEIGYKILADYLCTNSFLSVRHKLLYIATPKVACTSLKWWFADLEGYSKVLSEPTGSAESSPELVVHDTFYKIAPSVSGLTLDALEVPLHSDEYFRFAVVRNPYKRIFSAWQSKLLLREPLQIQPYRNCEFFHLPIGSGHDIARAFEGFLEHLASRESPNYWDIHWTPQAVLLRPDLIAYTRLAQIENVEELRVALAEHLGPEIPDPFSSRSSNESLIPYLPEFITDRAAELIRLLYAQDFELFGYDDQQPEAKGGFSSGQLSVALKAIELIRGRHQRLGEIRTDRDGQITNLYGQVARLNGQVDSLNGQVASLVVERDNILQTASWRITKPLRILYPIIVRKPLQIIGHNTFSIARHILHVLPISYHYKQAIRKKSSQSLSIAAATLGALLRQAMNAFREGVPKGSPDGAESSHAHGDPYSPEVLALGKTNRFLLVSHELSLTGAPRAVLFLARALFQLHGVRSVVISPSDGAMREEFEREGFPTVVDAELFTYQSYSFGACRFVMGFEKVIVTSLASYAFVRYFRGIAKHLSWWIHETEAGFTAIRKATSDLALLFASCESIWLGSPICIPYASQYAPVDRLHVLLYGCEDEAIPQLSSNNGTVVFSLFATVEPRKGHDIFLDAVARLHEDDRRRGVFRIIGSPRDYGESQVFYRRMRAAASSIREVEFIPHVPHDMLNKFYSETDVMVSVSRDDPMPIVITQGLMFAKVCLCSSAIGHAQLLQDGKDALIFPSGSSGMLAEKIAWILNNRDASKAIGLAGRQVYEKHFRMDSFIRNVDVAQRMQ